MAQAGALHARMQDLSARLEAAVTASTSSTTSGPSNSNSSIGGRITDLIRKLAHRKLLQEEQQQRLARLQALAAELADISGASQVRDGNCRPRGVRTWGTAESGPRKLDSE